MDTNTTENAMDTIRNTDDPLNTTARLRTMREIESELESVKEVPLTDMTQEELAVVILHDPDLNERRAALRMYKLDVLHEVEMKHLRVMAEIRKGVRK
jgi:hypothetical protein